MYLKLKGTLADKTPQNKTKKLFYITLFKKGEKSLSDRQQL